MSRNSECALCGNAGWIRIQRDDGVFGVVRCDCLRNRILESKLLTLPSRFQGCRFDNYSPIDDMQQQALRQLMTDPGKNFYLHGFYGRGKTHLAIAQYCALVAAGQLCHFVSMSDLIHELRRVELDSSHDSQIIDHAKYSDSFHLFIDDIDKFKPTDFKGEALFDLIDTIYRRKLSLTVTTNWNLTGLAELERLDPAILRRLDDMCTAVAV